MPKLLPNAAAAGPADDAGPSFLNDKSLDPCVPTPRCEEHARCLLGSSDSRSSLQSATADSETVAGISPLPPLQAAVRELDARLPLADILPLKQGEGYLVVRRRLPAPAPASAPSSAPTAAAAWSAADEARHQRSLQQLAALVALREQAWPQIQAWLHRAVSRRQAVGAASEAAASPGGCSPSEQLAHWATIQRLRQLQKIQNQWRRLQAVERQLVAAQAAAPEQQAPHAQQQRVAPEPPAPAQPEQPAPALAPKQQQAPAAAEREAELEASFTLMHLSSDAISSMPPPRAPQHLRPPSGAGMPTAPSLPGGRHG